MLSVIICEFVAHSEARQRKYWPRKNATLQLFAVFVVVYHATPRNRARKREKNILITSHNVTRICFIDF